MLFYITLCRSFIQCLSQLLTEIQMFSKNISINIFLKFLKCIFFPYLYYFFSNNIISSMTNFFQTLIYLVIQNLNIFRYFQCLSILGHVNSRKQKITVLTIGFQRLEKKSRLEPGSIFFFLKVGGHKLILVGISLGAKWVLSVQIGK